MTAAGKGTTIRKIESGDVGEVFSMINALADHEGMADWLKTDASKLRASGFAERPAWRGFIAENADGPFGFATYTAEYHIWSGAPVIRLDDIYVDPARRGGGTGENLMRAVFAEAEAIGAIVVWSVRADNYRAIAFYERLGAEYQNSGKCLWRPTGQRG